MTVRGRLRARCTSRAAERGSVSIWLALGAFVMIVVVGMAVDLSGQVLAQQHARDVAQQAARAGGQEVVEPAALRGTGVTADPSAAATAARSYLTLAGLQGTVNVTTDRVLVTATDTYEPKFLGIIGIRGMTVSGQGEARTVRTLDGIER